MSTEPEQHRDDDQVVVISRRTLRRVMMTLLAVIVLVGIVLGAFLAGRSTAPTTTTSAPQAHAKYPNSATIAPTTIATSTTSLPMTSTTTAPPATSAPTSPLFTAGTYSGTEPSTIDFSPGCCSVITGISWSSWTSAQAQGTGTFQYDTCANGCVNGPFDPYPAVITLSGPIGGQFTVLTRSISGGPTGGVTTWKYPTQWPAGAK